MFVCQLRLLRPTAGNQDEKTSEEQEEEEALDKAKLPVAHHTTDAHWSSLERIPAQ